LSESLLNSQFRLPIGFELTAVFLFAVTGALLAIDRRYDIVGVFVMAFVAAIGGGLIRDGLFIQKGPPLVLTDARLLYAIVAATLLSLVFGHYLKRLNRLFLLVDALGLGTYAMVGTQRALIAGLPVASAVIVGIANGVGGGVLRDVLTGEETLLFRPGQLYILAALAGVLVFVGLAVGMKAPAPTAALAGIAVTFVARVAAIRFGITTSPARPLLGPPGNTADS
jgi:uncharacterized membrane protein YeiH